MEKIKVGFIGLGQRGEGLLWTMLSCEEAEIVAVCDVYSKWKEMAKTKDTTLLLANRINHPTREMHQLFADSLFETIFGKEKIDVAKSTGTMYSDR